MYDVLPDISHVIIVCGKCDMRRGIDGLAAIVRLHYGMDPLEPGTLFLFCGNRRDRIKGLTYNGTGYCLLYIRLINGHFRWPRNSDEARDISPEQYKRFMSGFSLDSSIKAYKRLEELQ